MNPACWMENVGYFLRQVLDIIGWGEKLQKKIEIVLDKSLK